VIQALLDAGAPVRAMVRNESKARSLFGGTALEIVHGEFSDPAAVKRAFAGIERVFLLCPVHKLQVDWNYDLIGAAKRAGVRHVVRFSGIGARADALSELQRMHAVSDRALIDSGIGYTILQSNSFYQNLFWSAGLIKAKGIFQLPMSDARQSLVDLADTAAVAACALLDDKPANAVHVITGPEALSYYDVADTISHVTGAAVEYRPISWQEARDGMIRAGMPEWNAGVVVDFRRMVANGECSVVTRVVEQVTGRKPIPFEDFIGSNVEAFRPHIQAKPDPSASEGKTARDHFHELGEVLENEPHRTAGMTATYQFEIAGSRGGSFYVQIVDGKATVREGVAEDPNITIGMLDDDYIAMASKQISGPELFMMGKMKVKGDATLGMKAEKMFS
jgi:uncharacterized protein YbjT (DUF2867 family)/putative sterol carrier protein